MCGCGIVKLMLLTASTIYIFDRNAGKRFSDKVFGRTGDKVRTVFHAEHQVNQSTCYVRNAMVQCNEKYVYYI